LKNVRIVPALYLVICTSRMPRWTKARQKPNKTALGYANVLSSAWQTASRCWKAVFRVQRVRYTRAIRLAEAFAGGDWSGGTAPDHRRVWPDQTSPGYAETGAREYTLKIRTQNPTSDVVRFD
jgi:hypothetical protein